MPSPTPEIKKITMHLKCLLTDEEKLECGENLANATNELNEIEQDKKRVNDDFKSKTSAGEAQVAMLSNRLRSGYEFRDVACEVHFNDPEDGKKTIYRKDIPDIGDGQTIVEVREMSAEEIELSNQLTLPIEGDTQQEESK